MNQLDPALLIEDLRKTRKYRDICDDTLRRVAVWASERYPRPAERLKAAKRKLHQIHGAFLQGKDLTKVEKLIAEIAPGASENALHSTCREILEFHASTRERVQMLDQLFPELLASAGHIRALLDCACGLNAFAFPWMKLPGDAHYIGTDINNRLVSAINGFFSRVSLPAEALCHDLLCGPPPCKADVALLLKVLPTLEQQHKGAAVQVLNTIRDVCLVRCAIVSFPAKSLGGHYRGMNEYYRMFMDEVLGELRVSAHRVDTDTEVFYIVLFE